MRRADGVLKLGNLFRQHSPSLSQSTLPFQSLLWPRDCAVVTTNPIEGGKLVIANQSGSATGSGPVSVTRGKLGGSGIIAGATTIDTGGGMGTFLAPAAGTTVRATLTIQTHSLSMPMRPTLALSRQTRTGSRPTR